MGNAESKSPSDAADAMMADTLRQHQVVVFSKRACGHCVAVKNLLAREVKRLHRDDGCKSSTVHIIELDDDDNSIYSAAEGEQAPTAQQPLYGKAEQRDALVRMTGVNSVPQVFINRRFVGGADDTARMARHGALRLAMLEAARCPVPATAPAADASTK